MWEYENVLAIRLVIDKHGMLQESELCFEVFQEYFAGTSRGDTVPLGSVKLNLAEFVVEGGSNDEGEREGVTRRYLMQASKINSTLKVGLGGSTNWSQAKLRLGWDTYDTNRWRYEFHSVSRFFDIPCEDYGQYLRVQASFEDCSSI